MKKIKSLFSLMLVMILMLSVAGPMAFADSPDGTQANPYTVTVTVADPVYSPSQGKYIQNGCAVVNDQTGTTLSVVPSDFMVATVSEDNTTATAFPSDKLAVGSIFQGTNGVYYKVGAASNATISKPVLTVTPEVVFFDVEKQEYSASTAKLEGLVGADQVFCEFTTSTVGNSVSITPINVVVKNGDINVAGRYVVNTASKEFTKPTFSITLAEPVFNAATNKYDVSGAADHTVTTIKLAGGDFSVTPTFDVNNIVVSNVNSTATATLDPSYVTLTSNGSNVTAAFAVDVTSSSFTKQEVHIFPNSPVNGKANGYYALNKDGSAFSGYNVYATVYIDGNGVANIDRSSVQIINVENNLDYVDRFDVKLHTASNDGAGSTPTTTPSPSTPPVSTKTKLVIQAVDAEKAYNGYSFTASQARGVKYADGTALLSGHTLNASVLKIQYTRRSDGLNYTDYTDIYKVGTYDKKLIIPAANVILDAAGNDVTSQYDISTINGVLTIYNAGWVSPDTGDHSNIGLWITLLAISAVAVAAVVVVVLKKGKKA